MTTIISPDDRKVVDDGDCLPRRMFPGMKSAAAAVSSSSRAVIFFFVVLFACAFLSARWFNGPSFLSSRAASLFSSTRQSPTRTRPKPRPTPTLLTCPTGNPTTATCPSSTRRAPPPTAQPPVQGPAAPLPQSPACPGYFRWIHEDLRPWRSSGISKEAVERAANRANFRLVGVGGRLYLDRYHGAFQTRDVFTLWGLVQLARRYPGRLPDFDLMFNLDDMPVVKSADYRGSTVPPPLFRYCKDDSTLDIVFPDWSFWGWPEVNIKPWEALLEEIMEGNERVKWKDREPYAFWKGNQWVAGTRQDLLKCNVSGSKDWNARLYSQDWVRESKQGFKGSNLANQCTHRYKIYIEGRAWSVSEKYILACDSPMLLVNTRFQDFFTRGLMPGQQYLPIPDNDKCRSIKAAVDWGNTHQKEAQAIGKAGSGFIQEELKMDFVYDYMLHLLTEYSRLLTYKPTRPKNAIELCLESMACPEKGLVRTYMMESMVAGPSDSEPCTMPPRFHQGELKDLLTRKANYTLGQKSSGKREKFSVLSCVFTISILLLVI